MWVKYRHTFAWGKDDKWSYVEIPDDWNEYGYTEDQLGEFLDEEWNLGADHKWIDKYRGFEYEPVETIPYDEIMKRLNRSKNAIEYYIDRVKKFQKMLDESGHVTKEDFNV